MAYETVRDEGHLTFTFTQYAITQEEEDAELVVFVPNNVYKKDIKVDLSLLNRQYYY